METGCTNILLSKPPSKISLIINIKRMPANSGSVGKNISIGKPGANSLNGTDKGTRKTIANSNLSKAKKAAITNKRTMGIILK